MTGAHRYPEGKAQPEIAQLALGHMLKQAGRANTQLFINQQMPSSMPWVQETLAVHPVSSC
jgi:hypothetical protein